MNQGRYYDDEVELDGFLDQAFDKGKRILVCIDDIARTDDVVAFCSVYAKYVRAEKPIYFVCTGLFKNLDAIGRVKNLTFFRRAASINVGALSDVSITNKYRKHLNLDMPDFKKEVVRIMIDHKVRQSSKGWKSQIPCPSIEIHF